MYNYLEAIKNDNKEHLENEVPDYMELLADDRDSFEEELNDTLWIDDSITGNASGSYTFNRERAKEYVVDNMDLVADMADCFGIDNKTIGKKFREQNWKWFDVSIRCYLLGQAITEVLDELEA